MRRSGLAIIALAILMAGCAQLDERGTLAELRHRQIEISDVEVDAGLERAMESYQRFLDQADGSGMAPEAIRRLADLKVEKEYGLVEPGNRTEETRSEPALPAPETLMPASAARPETGFTESPGEADDAFERRTTAALDLSERRPVENDPTLDDLEKAGPREAIALYQRLLDEYPLYQRNDQVLYQMSRAYEELGQVGAAMTVMDRLAGDYPQSRYFDEVRRAR